MKLSRWAAVAVGVAAALAVAAPAAADYVADWSANGESAVIDHDTVRLQGGNTSVETGNLGINVNDGEVVSFTYTLHDGAECVGGAPRVFVIANGTITNSWDQLQPAGEQCGVDNGDGSFTVTFTVGNAGLITQAGIVFDNGGAGYVEVSGLSIGEQVVLFAAKPEETTTPEPTVDQTADPTPAVTETPEETAAPVAAPELPTTGSPLVPALLILGGGGLAAGLVLHRLSRSRGVTFRA